MWNSKLENLILKNEKLKIMKNHFFKYNSLFSINVCGLCFIMMYFMIVYLFYLSRRKSYFDYDDFMASVEGLYLKVFN